MELQVFSTASLALGPSYAGPLQRRQETATLHNCCDTSKISRLSCRSSLLFSGSSEFGRLRSSGLARRKYVVVKKAVSARSEANKESAGNSLDIWIGRLAMLGFVGAIVVEIATGKGLLQNAGVTTPAPLLALFLAAVVGVITAFGVFRSASAE